MEWKVLKLPMEAGEGDLYGRKQGELLWPQRFSPAEIAELKTDPNIWMALYQQEPQPQEGAWFNWDWVENNFYDPLKLDITNLNRYIMVDPALSTKSSGNYTAMVVIGLGEDRNYYILQFYRDRVDPYQRTDALFRLVRRWKPVRVGYEAYGMTADVPYLRERMEQANFRFNLQELGKKGSQHNLSKKDRIRQLIPTFREGRIWFPKQQMFTDSNHNEMDLVRVFFEQEYEKYPSSKYDDMIDVLARIHDEQMRFEFPEGVEEDYNTDSGGGSWLTG